MGSETQAPAYERNHVTIGGEDYFSIEDLAQRVVEKINDQVPSGLTKLARAAIDGRKALDEAMQSIGKVQDDLDAKVKMFLNDLRSTRFAAVSEVSQMTQGLKDIRQFFLGQDYEAQIKRLKEFVELCERLEALKQHGTLDAIADTIIKLA